MQQFLEKTILASRWLLAGFYLGMAAALAVYLARFLGKLWKLATDSALFADDNEMLLSLLLMLDAVLVAGLVVTVIVSSWDSLVSRLEREANQTEMKWVSKTDPGNLKIKLATALVAISGINLLQTFLKIGSFDDRSIGWAIAIHGMFLLGVLILAVADRLEGTYEGKTQKDPDLEPAGNP